MAKSEENAVSWGEMIPFRLSDWREDEGIVTLLVPRFGRGRLGAFLDRRFHLPPYRVQLDAIGSFIWKRCDGESLVIEIGSALEREFGDRIQPMQDRLVLFLRKLTRGRFLRVGNG